MNPPTLKRISFDRLFTLSLITSFIVFLAIATVYAQKGDDPLRASFYGLELEGQLAGYFTSASGIGSESEVVEHKIVDDKTGQTIVRKFPGRRDWTEVILRRGLSASMDIWQWRRQVESGNPDARMNVTIIGLNQAYENVVRWELFNAWPKRVVMQMDDQNQIVEELILVSEGFVREDIPVPHNCSPDDDNDGDTDGKDLFVFIADLKPDCLEALAAEFGNVNVR